ncbi:hypothetical protein EII34_09480 [Arachnia propionica]|uniref:Uncharacterized protein n=1 Tax=Arachnia propionica TaxID=1750 RepID=A0A3P1T579_9ACTN|nr:hypothetical protein [Arachnia propionica]RRD04529.1 hypothetical protein EII34_09480 [Arachnia propionica]
MATYAQSRRYRDRVVADKELRVALEQLDRQRFPGTWAAGMFLVVQLAVRWFSPRPEVMVRELVEVFAQAGRDHGPIWWLGRHITSVELQERTLEVVWDITLMEGILQLADADKLEPSCIEEVVALLEKGVTLAELRGDRAKVVESWIRLSSAKVAMGSTRDGLDLGEQARREAGMLGDAGLLCRARLPLVVAALRHAGLEQTLALISELRRASWKARDQRLLTWSRRHHRNIRRAQGHVRRMRRRRV